MILKTDWTKKLPQSVLTRLGECRSKRDDIKTLVDARWDWMKETGMDKDGFMKEDAVGYILDLLDCNGQFFDPSQGEYEALCNDHQKLL